MRKYSRRQIELSRSSPKTVGELREVHYLTTFRNARMKRSAPPMLQSSTIQMLLRCTRPSHRRSVARPLRTSQVGSAASYAAESARPEYGTLDFRIADVELGLGSLRRGIDGIQKAIEAGFRTSYHTPISPPPSPSTARWMRPIRPCGSPPPQSQSHDEMVCRACAEVPWTIEGLRKAGLPEE